MNGLEKYRKEIGASRETLGQRLGMSYGNINALCQRGSRRPNHSLILRMCAALGVSAEQAVEMLMPENQGGAVE